MKGEAWLLLGASSPILRAFARRLAAEGAVLLLAGRDGEDLAATAADLTIRHQATAKVLNFDATALASHSAFVAEALAAADGRTLNIVAAFANAADQSAMEADPALAAAMIAVNYSGLVSLLLHLAPVLEAQGRGHVIVLGSVAGDRGRASNYIYGSTKAAAQVFAEGLAVRLGRAGVTLTAPRLGFVDTGLTWGKAGVFLALPPEDCARLCLDMARKGRFGGYVPGFWRLIMTIIRVIPWPIYRRLKL